MMRIDPDKRWVLALLVGAVLVVFFLAIGLTGLKLNPGLLISFSARPQNSFVTDELRGFGWLVDIFRIILALAIVLFPIYLVYMLVNPKRRKQLIRELLIFGVILFVFDRLRAFSENMSNPENPLQAGANPSDLPPPADTVPLADFVNNPPAWLVILIVVFVVIIIAAIIFGIFWFVLRKRDHNEDSITRVAQEAEDALLSIQAGGNLRDTIIQCYRSMVQAVKTERGINRETNVTPREFVSILTSKGLPAGPVKDLTRIFEDVRYGNLAGGMRQQIEAVSCLEEIVEACRRQKEAT